jgi:IS4 transposase
LTLFDRGFTSFSLMYIMMSQEDPQHFVMRCRKNQNAEVMPFLKQNEQSKLIELRATSKAIDTLKNHGYIITKTTRIKVRLVKIKLSTGEDEVLITNLLDEQKYTIADLYELYGLRWRIETTFGKQKNQLQMEQFSGHKVISIEQDYNACLIVSNLQSLI